MKYQTHITKQDAEAVATFLQQEYLRLNHYCDAGLKPLSRAERREAIAFLNALQRAITVLQNATAQRGNK
tara:strand:- start:1150 stop:1359 length:210 start_codon:yes stop_codon:yes gene_type:complete